MVVLTVDIPEAKSQRKIRASLDQTVGDLMRYSTDSVQACQQCYCSCVSLTSACRSTVSAS